MHELNSLRVTELAKSPTGRALWEFLNSDETFARLETATLLDRPAIEGVLPQVQEQFGIDGKDARWRPVIAEMVREVMTDRGYTLVNRGELFRDLDLFIQPLTHGAVDGLYQ